MNKGLEDIIVTLNTTVQKIISEQQKMSTGQAVMMVSVDKMGSDIKEIKIDLKEAKDHIREIDDIKVILSPRDKSSGYRDRIEELDEKIENQRKEIIKKSIAVVAVASPLLIKESRDTVFQLISLLLGI